MNSLQNEQSPYLRQHAGNPVEWLPWGKAAFEKAAAEEKPIFLSIGYSTCHWCHVMAHESFEDQAIASLMNEHFVCIKVDREERPDVDHLYMLFVQATTGQGGWPMSVWLTPDLKPFYGGTYFPPEDRWGRPGFPTVLERIAQLWATQRQSILQQSQQVLMGLAQSTTTEPGTALPTLPDLANACQGIAGAFDEKEGGFSPAPKFPRPSVLNLLLRYADRVDVTPESREKARGMVLFTLDKMASGGIHDFLGGGFHRYSVDGRWHVPHFEKMLYDQAQLSCSYLEAYQLSGKETYLAVVHDILEYVHRDLTHPEGGFFSAEDADSLTPGPQPHLKEGAYYVWTEEEILSLLGADPGALFGFHYGVLHRGNVQDESDPQDEFAGLNVLYMKHSSGAHAGELAAARGKLLRARATRPRPHRDEKILTAWNGMMISAYARAAGVLSHKPYLQIAIQAAEFVLKYLVTPAGGLLRTYCNQPGTVRAVAADYACFIQGLLDLYEVQGETRWLELAWSLQQEMDTRFWDSRGGGYFEAAADETTLLLRLKETYDGAEPASNSIAVSNLLRLSDILGISNLRDGIEKCFLSVATTLIGAPGAAPQMMASFLRHQAPPLHIVVVGHVEDPRTAALLQEVHRPFLPSKNVLVLRPNQKLDFLGAKADFYRGLVTTARTPAVFVCESYTCRLPVSDPLALRSLLAPLNKSLPNETGPSASR